MLDGYYGIEYGALGISKRLLFHHYNGLCRVMTTTNKFASVRFVSTELCFLSIYFYQVEHPWRSFFFGTCPACAQEGMLCFQYFRLYEKVAEGRMCGIACCRGKHYFGIAGYLHLLACSRAVG